MSDAEIIKELENKVRGSDWGGYDDEDLLDLINRQKAEIERLSDHFREVTKKIKAEAIKEFAERLKENTIDVDVSYGYGREHYTEAVAVIEIDNLVKEMAGDLG